jgi:hypothetical protein
MNHSETAYRDDWAPADPAPILLVETNPELRSSRGLLLGFLQHPVLAVSGYQEVTCLSGAIGCCLVAINLSPSEQEAQRVAFHTRKIWPRAKILLFGEPSQNFDDPLYDDSVLWNPSVVIETALRLIEATQVSLSAWEDRRNFDDNTRKNIDDPQS